MRGWASAYQRCTEWGQEVFDVSLHLLQLPLGKGDENITRREARQGFHHGTCPWAQLCAHGGAAAVHGADQDFTKEGYRPTAAHLSLSSGWSCKFTPWSTVTPFRACKVYKGVWLLLPFVKGSNCLCTSSVQSSATATHRHPLSFMCCRGGQRLRSTHSHFTRSYKARAFSLSFHRTNDTSKAWLSSSRIGMNGSQINQGNVWLFWQATTKKNPRAFWNTAGSKQGLTICDWESY